MTSDSGYFPLPRKLTVVSTKLKNVPENRKSISEESSSDLSQESDTDAEKSRNPNYLKLNLVAVKKHMNKCWVENKANVKVFYINFFEEKKTQREKPRDAFIKFLPQSEQFQGGSKRQTGRKNNTMHLREKELSWMARRRKRDGWSDSDEGDDSDSDLSSAPVPAPHQKKFNLGLFLIPSSVQEGSRRHQTQLIESETSGGTMLYQAVYQGFKEIIGKIFKPSNNKFESLDPVLSFKSWIESQLNRLNIWSQEVGVKEANLDSLKDHKAQDSNSDLHKTLTTYLKSVYEALENIEQNIVEGLVNLGLVEKQ